MKKYALSTSLLATAILLPILAVAGPKCTTQDQTNWLSPLDMQKKIVNEYGYTIQKFKTTSGNCYEIYGMEPKQNSKMQRIEVYFNPITGAEVKKKLKR